VERLEAELAAAKAAGVKEGVRVGHLALGAALLAKGDLAGAFKAVSRSRDYCTTEEHTLELCLGVLTAAVAMGNFTHVTSYVQKAEGLAAAAEPLTAAKLRAAAGLALLEQRKYKLAARRFAEAPAELGSEFSAVLAAPDVALYGGLTALASFDRAELQAKVLGSVAFRSYLDLLPALRDAIGDFAASRYSTSLAALDALRPRLACDPHLHDHAVALLAAIRVKAITAYCAPFTTVRLAAMATALNTQVPALEKELAGLILSDDIAARIDSRGGVLVARHADARTGTFQRALAVGEAYERDAKALLVRASLVRNDVVLKGRPGAGGQRGLEVGFREPGLGPGHGAYGRDKGRGFQHSQEGYGL